LGEETVELAAGGIERALILFRAIMDQWPAVFVNRVAEKSLSGPLSERRVVMEISDDLPAQQPQVVHVPANRLWGKG